MIPGISTPVYRPIDFYWKCKEICKFHMIEDAEANRGDYIKETVAGNTEELFDSGTLDRLNSCIEALRPWRYNHSCRGVVIESDVPESAKIFDDYGKQAIIDAVKVLLKDKEPGEIRAIDLGCLEGHHSDILCSMGLKEVVSIDLSENHVARAKLLLQELKGYANSTVLQGNVSDEAFMATLGKFDIVFFHGLLYHLKDPVRIFDIIRRFVPENGDFFMFLSTQYFMSYGALISPNPMAGMQIKPLERYSGERSDGILYSPTDQSCFERCSFRLNPAAVYQLLKLHDFNGLIAYDTPGRYSHSFHSNLIATRDKDVGTGKTEVTGNRISSHIEDLNRGSTVPGVRFYEWNGNSVNSYDFRRRLGALFGRLIVRMSGMALVAIHIITRKIAKRG